MGKVTDKDTGEPISEIIVMALKVKDQKVVASYQGKTNSDGVYLIDEVPEGDYLIFPYPAKGYTSDLPQRLTKVPPQRKELNALNVVFELEKDGGIMEIMKL